MKKQSKVNEFKVTIKDQEFTLDIRETDKNKSMPNCLIYECMSFDSEMVPFKRFKIVYSWQDRSYWAWTMDCIREEDRAFRENVAELLNSGVLKMVA